MYTWADPIILRRAEFVRSKSAFLTTARRNFLANLATELTDYLNSRARSFLSNRFIRDPQCQILWSDCFAFLIEETSRLPKLIARTITGEIIANAILGAIQNLELLSDGQGSEQVLRLTDANIPEYQRFLAKYPDW